MATTTEIIYVGNERTLSVTIKDAVTNAPIDPTTLTLLVRPPYGSVATYVYNPSSGIIVRDGQGLYHALVILDTAGWWRYDYFGTGAALFSSGDRFEVLAKNTDGVS